jgi:hypothetical protein
MKSGGFEVSEIPRTGSSLLLIFFQIPKTGGSLILNFFHIPGTGGYHKNQIPHTGHEQGQIFI